MRWFMAVTVVGVGWLVSGRLASAEDERYQFRDPQIEFTVIGKPRREVMTPTGRRLMAESEIQDIRRYGDDIYLVSQHFIRRYDVTQDLANGERQFEEVFRFFYQAPAKHEINGQLCWARRDQYYYPVYFKGYQPGQERELVMVFRGLVRIYPMPKPQETRVQYLPYIRLPDEGQWLAAGFFSEHDFWSRRRLTTLTVTRKGTDERRMVLLNENDELSEPAEFPATP